jgi:hypothetical protein
MSTVDKYPLDFDALKKGDVVSVAKQEDIFQVKAAHEKFWSQSLALKERIQKEMALRGLPVTVRHDHGALVICTDPDASEYNDRTRKMYLRRFARTHKRNLSVDRSKLEAADLEKHDRNNGIYGAVLAAALKVRRRMVLQPAERKTPGLPGPEASQ